MPVPRSFSAVCAAIAALAGCATRPIPSVPGTPQFEVPAGPSEMDRAIERRRAAAQKLEQANDLGGAATQWRIVLLLAPEDRQAAERLAALQASIGKSVADELAVSRDALRRGDVEQAQHSFLRVLALDAGNKDAIDGLREIDRQRAMRRGAGLAARVQAEQAVVGTRNRSARGPSAEAGDYDVEQSLELLRAGDSVVALAEVRRYVAANPRDRALRERIAGALYSRARELERQGDGNAAVGMYEEAIKTHGSPPRDWSAQSSRLKARLAAEEYEKGVRMMSGDIDAAISHFEAALRLVPHHTQAQLQLDRAQKMQQKLRAIGPARSAN